MIKNRDYSSLDQFLKIEQLSSLHLYVFLLGWTNVRTINDANVLEDSIKSSVQNTFESSLSKLTHLFLQIEQNKADDVRKMFRIIQITDRFSRLAQQRSKVS